MMLTLLSAIGRHFLNLGTHYVFVDAFYFQYQFVECLALITDCVPVK